MSELFRRDPRAEWIARNRLHPMHKSLDNGPVFGPSGLLRKNPHIIGFIGPNGLKRIDRSGASFDSGQGSRRSAAAASEVILPLHQVPEPAFYIVVVLDLVSGRLNGHDKDTLGLAQQLANRNDGGGAVVAIAFGELKDDSLDKAGVDRLIHLEGQHYSNYNPEQRCNDLQSIIAKNMDNRRKAAVEAESIVNSQSDNFMAWLRGLNTQDTVISYRKQCLNNRDVLLEKAFIQLKNGKNSEAVLAELATKLTNKFMHAPTSALQSAAQGGELDKLLYLRDIFNIDSQD